MGLLENRQPLAQPSGSHHFPLAKNHHGCVMVCRAPTSTKHF